MLSFALWLLIVGRLPLSIAFPTAIGVSMIAIALGSVLVLSEGIGLGQIIGMLLILAGFALVARGPERADEANAPRFELLPGLALRRLRLTLPEHVVPQLLRLRAHRRQRAEFRLE